MELVVADLPDDIIGQIDGGTISIDINAAGYGWFVDATPSDDSEFATATGAGEFQAGADSPAYGAIDLLTVLLHEYGHELGLGHSTDVQDVMAPTLAVSIRRVPTESTVANATIMDGNGQETLHVAPAAGRGLPILVLGGLPNQLGFSPMRATTVEFDEPFVRPPVLTAFPVFDRHSMQQLVELSGGGSSDVAGDDAAALGEFLADVYEPRYEHLAAKL